VWPQARTFHGAAAIDGRMFVHGGLGIDDRTNLCDLWSFDPTTLLWTPLETTGCGPSPRHGHALAAVPAAGTIVVSGGRSGRLSFHNDAYVLDTGTLMWRAVAVGTNRPSRAFHSMTALSHSGCVDVIFFNSNV
jgi:hypothetical protein